ncbi:thioesterase family protein [Mycobacterium sp. M1]|uniref:Thioesterase family protein n=2 Tax=Mycolicibacter acidiphilus TaxID=2835306 RepID=A0ABS5RPF9_9MYCO|nr:thioesterase family protein [Mycolicibacter acidiphilus]
MQHGGPPAALLARAVERVRPDPDMAIARLTADMLGPIPQGRIRTEATILRPGKRIEMVEAKLWANGKLAVTATAWRIRRSPGSTQAQAQASQVPVPPLPGEQPQRYFPRVSPDWGYGRAIEWRFVHGGYQHPGPASVWTRLRIPLVLGEETAPVHYLAVVADSANGISAELSPIEWAFIPPSVTLTLGREPAGDWINLSARSHIADSGTGFTQGELFDRSGLVGSVEQPLLVMRQ